MGAMQRQLVLRAAGDVTHLADQAELEQQLDGAIDGRLVHVEIAVCFIESSKDMFGADMVVGAQHDLIDGQA